MTQLLEIKGLYGSYGQTQILQDISLSLSRGEILGIVGESGSGKSTLLQSITGIEETWNPSRGSIEYKGIPLDAKTRKKVFGRDIGVVFQNPSYSLVPTRRISKQFEETAQAHVNWSRDQVKTKALDLFNRLGLKEGDRVYRAYPFELSGGMQQRVGLALALLLSPDLILCDEPTSALDVQVENEIIGTFDRLRRENGLAILLVTHNLSLASYLCDKILVMYGGRVLEYRDREGFAKGPLHPYSKDLLEAVPRFMGPRPRPIEGRAPKFPLGKKCVYLDRCKEAGEECRNWDMETYQLEDGRVSCWRKKNG